MGADCILLIVSCLEDDEIKHLSDLALSLNMDVLVETHTHEEIIMANKLKALIGINNRNLKTLKTDINTVMASHQI